MRSGIDADLANQQARILVTKGPNGRKGVGSDFACPVMMKKLSDGEETSGRV
jgi:hypothetical protein